MNKIFVLAFLILTGFKVFLREEADTSAILKRIYTFMYSMTVMLILLQEGQS